MVFSETNSRGSKSEHETGGLSNEKSLCSTAGSSFLVCRVGAEGMSMAQDFSCRINVESRSLLRTTFGWPKEHGLGSSEDAKGRSISQRKLCEMNGAMNFASSNRS
jgi:hypothetical protein